MTSETLGIIPARGGSKGIPRKNVALVGGQPLLFWTVSEAEKCDSLDRLIVSTEDKEIANLAQAYGVEVPFLRPMELAGDETPGIEPIIHAAEWLEDEEGYSPHYLVVLQPTSPLRSAADIEGAIGLAREKSADAVVSVTLARTHPYLAKRVRRDGRMEDLVPLERQYDRRQEFPPAHVVNGAVHVVRREVLLRERTLYTNRTFAYIMPPERSIDVDDLWDLHMADLIVRERVRDAGS
jgi:N-acylneuraminate cytidylyltransferase/CMP-N,N'-diacetyllegionaminic acid synthase